MNKLELYFQSRISEAKKNLPKFFDEAYFRDRVSVTILVLSIVFLLAVWIAAVVGFHITEFTVPVRYNSFLGVTEIGSSLSLFRLPIFFTLCVATNILLSRVVYKKDKLIGYILSGTNIILGVITIIIIINFARIIGV